VNLYLDEELQGDERADFEKHLRKCEPCRLLLQNEGGFLELVRESVVLPVASSELRARVKNVLQNTFTARVEPENVFMVRPATNYGYRNLFIMSAVTTLLILAGLLVIRERRDRNIGGPSDFALMAADTHLRHERGQLPLEINSEAPQKISSWFDNKLPFRVKLPNYQESSGQERLYELEGARLVGYKKDYAAYVAYQMRQRPISLVITSDTVARPSGGQEIVAKGLTFHYDSIAGLKVITWSDRGLTYALVSDLEERGQESCIVCHHGTNDQEFIESLKPKT
jgi:hypothetical protein